MRFPFICHIIPAGPAYGVIPQLIRYSTACAFCQDFLYRRLLPTRMLRALGFRVVKWKLSLVGVTDDHGYVPFVVVKSHMNFQFVFLHKLNDLVYVPSDHFLIHSLSSGVKKGTGTANPFGATEFALGFQWCSYCSIFGFKYSVL